MNFKTTVEREKENFNTIADIILSPVVNEIWYEGAREALKNNQEIAMTNAAMVVLAEAISIVKKNRAHLGYKNNTLTELETLKASLTTKKS